MAKFDPERESHKAWLGLVQPVGLVVSPPALIKAQVVLDKNVIPAQQALLGVVVRPASVFADADPVLLDFPRFTTEVLGWSPGDLAGGPGGPPVADALAVALPDYGETLRPTYAVIDGMAAGKVLLLVQVVDPGLSLDKPPSEDARTGWPASPQARLERLLRDTGVSAGLLLNGDELRLVYAPRGESSGHMGFPIAEMCTVSGRPLLAAVHMLLSEHRVFGAPDKQRLLDLLVESRKYQSEVSNRLAEQVLGALWELLRGFQAADEAANQRVLFDLPRTDPQQIYGGLLTIVMRLVFLLYAEDQGLMPDDPVYARNYAIGGLFERLREDAGRYPDTMDQRFGAYAWLLSTFRMVFDGGGHGGLNLPTRHGQLFNPDEYPFLEGRSPGIGRVMGETFEAPRVSDGIIWRVLQGLLVLDGERLSYRALDVEQVGSVYESMMGFDVRTLPGRTIAVSPKRVVFDVDALLSVTATKRAAWLKEHTECDLAPVSARELQEARTAEDVVAALGRKVALQTPRALAPGALFLQPGEERRRSGSHYTPRELTEPIVRTTLRPVLDLLGPRPTPEQILDLKVCDPAMGSGAFLVEACRQLAAALVAAWEVHDSTPKLPPDEDPLLHARRLVAQRCLYGVDKNRFAVNLAKLSLWLVTLAKDHAFTFLDHALKHGDSLVGLTRPQIGAFHWNPPENDFGPLFKGITSTINTVSGWRRQIQALGEGDYDQRRMAWKEAEDVVQDVRRIGDLCIAAFFGAEKDKDREVLRRAHRAKVDTWKAGGDRSEIDGIVAALRAGERPVLPLHWEIEFPEVFGRENSGFDAVIGNPPFLGGNRVTEAAGGPKYQQWLKECVTEAKGQVDLCVFFFRRAFELINISGTVGLLATNSLSRGDNRIAGLAEILSTGGRIYCAVSDFQWPGEATVLVSRVHIAARAVSIPDWSIVLNQAQCSVINSRLQAQPEQEAAEPLIENSGKAHIGTFMGGNGFVLSSSEADILLSDQANGRVVTHLIGGEEVVAPPSAQYRRMAINFGKMTLEEAGKWPAALQLVRERVWPHRQKGKDHGPGNHGKKYWWQHVLRADPLYDAISGLKQCLVTAKVATHHSVRMVPTGSLFNEQVFVFAFEGFGAFSLLQSTVHESWAIHNSSRQGAATRYSVTKAFATFPFPKNWMGLTDLERVGAEYHAFRAELMLLNDEGLTTIYRRFHDPNETDPNIARVRELHAAVDRAVLDAYGWTDIQPTCEFIIDDEDEDSEGESSASRRRHKKHYRYHWPDSVREEVLARLLDLNQTRYQDEVAAGLHGKLDGATPTGATTAKMPEKASKGTKKANAAALTGTLALFSSEEES